MFKQCILACFLIAYESAIPIYAQVKKDTYAWDMLKDADFKTTYTYLIKNTSKASWLTKLNGPSSPVFKQQVAGYQNDFSVVQSCKPHDCEENNILIFYEKKQRLAFAMLTLNNSITFLGNPEAVLKSSIQSIANAK
jgi:Inhibitor of vertebrate lysozyme (Ivy)